MRHLHRCKITESLFLPSGTSCPFSFRQWIQLVRVGQLSLKCMNKFSSALRSMRSSVIHGIWRTAEKRNCRCDFQSIQTLSVRKRTLHYFQFQFELETICCIVAFGEHVSCHFSHYVPHCNYFCKDECSLGTPTSHQGKSSFFLLCSSNLMHLPHRGSSEECVFGSVAL